MWLHMAATNLVKEHNSGNVLVIRTVYLNMLLCMSAAGFRQCVLCCWATAFSLHFKAGFSRLFLNEKEKQTLGSSAFALSVPAQF